MLKPVSIQNSVGRYQPFPVKTTTKILTVVSLTLFLLAFFLPSRLTNIDFATLIEFSRNNALGYGIYPLTLFPIIVILLLLKKYTSSLILSVIIILTQINPFEQTIGIFFSSNNFLTKVTAFPLWLFLTIAGISVWLIYKSIRTLNYTWYALFLIYLIGIYLTLIKRNCRVGFIADMGIIKNDLELWFNNCGSFYAFWAAIIILNIAIFNELTKKNGW